MWISYFLRAFLSRLLKNLTFTLSKPIFITCNTPLYNTTYIKASIFFTISFKYCFFIIFQQFFYFSFLLCLSLSHSTVGATLPHPLTTTTTGITKPNSHHTQQPIATSPSSQQPPQTHYPQTHHTNPTINHHSTAIATITDGTHNLYKSVFPPPKTKSKTQQTNIKTTNQTQYHHKSQTHVRNHRPKIRKSIFFKFLTQNQITKPTQTQPHLSKPSHARWTTTTQPPQSIAETHKP